MPATAPHRALAAFAAGLGPGDLPVAVVEKVRCNLLHDLACAMAAHEVGPSVWPLVAARRPAEAALLCAGTRVPAEQAAFANAVLVHARAQDDTHFAAKCHAGAAVIPAALAVAERQGATGAELVTAIVAGYEVATAVGERLAAPATARGFRASGILGPLGAAAAAAVLLGLDEERTAHALALAASFSAGLNQTWLDGSSEYRWELGMAARNGVLAADLAAHGATGAAHALDGAAGFAAAFAGAGPGALDELELGRRWRILEVIYKPHPVCNITQTPVAVAVGIAAAHDLRAADVEAVVCAMHPADRDYPGTLGRAPFAGIGASLMSAPFCVALALRDRTVTLRGLGAYDDPELVALAARVTVTADPALPELAARLQVRTRAGALLEAELIPDAGTYGWAWAGVAANADRLRAEMGPHAGGLEALKAAVRAVDRLPSATPILSATEG